MKVSCSFLLFDQSQKQEEVCRMHMYTSVFRTHLGNVFAAEFAFYSELAQHKHIVLCTMNTTCNEVRIC
jgi:hypothetical protein